MAHRSFEVVPGMLGECGGSLYVVIAAWVRRVRPYDCKDNMTYELWPDELVMELGSSSDEILL